MRTSFHHQPEAQHPNFPLSTSRQADYPIFCAAALRCSTEQNALHTLIHQRHLTPSCGGHTPTAERTLDPARMFAESLTPRPELENSQHSTRTYYCNSPVAPQPPEDRHQQRHGEYRNHGHNEYVARSKP